MRYPEITEKDVDADKAAVDETGAGVEENDGKNGDRAQSVDIGAISPGVTLLVSMAVTGSARLALHHAKAFIRNRLDRVTSRARWPIGLRRRSAGSHR